MSPEVVSQFIDETQSSMSASAPVKKESAPKRDYFVHESAYVDEECFIGARTKISHFSQIMKGARIGNDCSIGQNVFIAPSAVIGNGVNIQNGVVICDGVVLQDGVLCEPSVVFTSVLNPRSEMVGKIEQQRTVVQRGATLGANSTILCGRTIGEYALVSAGVVVTADVPPHAVIAGAPAEQVDWICRCGQRRLPLEKSPITRCLACQRVYAKLHGVVQEAPVPGTGGT